jgi:hypothetical protein
MDDPFIRQYVEDLLRNIRTQVDGGAVHMRMLHGLIAWA